MNFANKKLNDPGKIAAFRAHILRGCIKIWTKLYCILRILILIYFEDFVLHF